MRRLLIFILTLAASHAAAQGPHEVLLLVNGASQESVKIASEWAELRAVPMQNVVELKLPDKYAAGEVSISRSEFTELIWKPAARAAEERGLNHILAWVYSSGFPVKITERYTVSITGLTFLRNKWPDEKMVKNAAYLSPLYAGRSSVNDSDYMPRTLYRSRRSLRDQMPLPSMMLGYTGKRGNSTDEVLACLRTGAGSDGTKPTGRVVIVDSDDLRSETRRWQFQDVVSELTAMGVNCIVTNEIPMHASGIMMGLPVIKGIERVRLKPGSMCDHLTSLAAVFESPGQTKCTEWIKAGATATSGTVVEPFAIWPKFPSARFYVYQASGCTIMESFYQSLRCPLQVLLIGEPLAAPWKDPASISVSGLKSGGVESLDLKITVKGSELESYSRKMYLVDGKVMGEQYGDSVRLGSLEDGEHVVRIVAYRSGMMQNQVFKEFGIKVKDGKLFVK